MANRLSPRGKPALTLSPRGKGAPDHSPRGKIALAALLLSTPAMAHENPYPLATLSVSQSDIPKVKTGYTAVLTEDDVFGLSIGQRLPVYFLRTDDEPTPGMFSDTELDALCRRYVGLMLKKAHRGADPEFGIGAIRYNDDGTATRDILAVWPFDKPCVSED